MGLCSVIEIGLTTQGCFSHCWTELTQSQSLSAPHPSPFPSRLGMHKKMGGDTAWTADPSRPEGYPFHMASCSLYKAGECSQRWSLSSQVTIKQNSDLPANEKGWMNSLVWLSTASALPPKMSPSQSTVLMFILLILSPSWLGKSEWVCGVLAGWGQTTIIVLLGSAQIFPIFLFFHLGIRTTEWNTNVRFLI